jgi:DNA-binding beta-propeller fold protein YncE
MRYNIASKRVAATAIAGLLTVGASGLPGYAAPALAEGDQLYVTNSALRAAPTAANVARFELDATGLTKPAGTVPAGQAARGIVFTPAPDATGQRYAYVSSQAGNEIDRYRVSVDGALTSIGMTPTRQPFGIAISPDGHTVYVTNFDENDGNGSVSAFHVESTGALILVNIIDSGAANPKGVAVTPDGRFLYVSHGTPNAATPSVLMGFAIGADGSLRGPVSKATIGSSGHRAVITPDGRFIYVTNQESGDVGDIFGFRIGPSGELTPVSTKPFEAGTWVEGAALSPDGRRLYVTALGVVGPAPAPVADGQVRGFTIAADGRLTEIERIAFGSDPVDLAFGLDGQNLYVADFSENTLTVFSVDPAGGLARRQTVSSQGPNPGFQGVVVQPKTMS